MDEEPKIYRITLSAGLTVVGIILLFGIAIVITLLAPHHVDPSWTQPTSPYQVQMYEIADPHIYLSSASSKGRTLQYVHHLKSDFSLLAFIETSAIQIDAPEELAPYVTRAEEEIKLTSRLLLLRPLEEQKGERTAYELYDPKKEEAFVVAFQEGIFGNWIDRHFTFVDGAKTSHQDPSGTLYVQNPVEFRIVRVPFGLERGWKYDPLGEPVRNVEELTDAFLGFRSRKELIEEGERIFAQEGCWYCHTDQTRTLVQDLVLNGSAEFPAPPSSPNEYIFEKITFPGTRRIGPDLSRVAIKRPHRDWHMSHFWAPRVESPGSVMPSFQHFFDADPRGGIPPEGIGIPNYRFEAIFQYLMTKGSRITPPNQGWWEGKDPIHTLLLIEGKKRFSDGE